MPDNAVTSAARLSIAPMMDWTDRHCRVFHRLLAPSALLYTEMVTTGAILFGDANRHLFCQSREFPLVLQLGGSEPNALSDAVAIAEPYGYSAFNLNVGCPSVRVQSGAFGACLMAEPELVRDCCAAMMSATARPVTVKTRIGIDDSEDFVFLRRFVDIVATAGVKTFVIHARKAWLKGLSPKENREIPPLCYEQVLRLKAERPDLDIIINGGIVDPQLAATFVTQLDGVMIGREAYQNPASLRQFEHALSLCDSPLDRTALLRQTYPYIDSEMSNGTPFRAIARHMLGLFNGLPGARQFRRHLSERMGCPKAGPQTFEDALTFVHRHQKAA